MNRRIIVSASLLALAAWLPAAEPAAIADLESRIASAGLKAASADLLALAGAYEAAGRPLEAGGALERALASGGTPDQRRRLGRLWEAAGRFEAAALAYKSAATGPDGAAAAWAAAQVVATWLQDRRRALADQIAVAKAWPKSPQAREALLAALADERWPDELRALRAEAEDLALARFPTDPAFAQAVANAAWRLAEAKQGDKALAAVRGIPAGAIRTEAEAHVLSRVGKPGEAADLWEKRWTESRDPSHLQRAAEAVDNSDKPRSARLWLKLATEHPEARWPHEILDRVLSLDASAFPAAVPFLTKAWSGSEYRLAVLALYRAVVGGDRAALVTEALRRDATALGFERLAEVAKADAAARALIETRAKQADRAGWACRLAVGLAQTGDTGVTMIAEAVRDGGLLDEGWSRRVLDLLLDRLSGRRDKPETVAQVTTLVTTVFSAPQHRETREMCKRLVKECVRDKAKAEPLLALDRDSDPLMQAWRTKGHQALAAMLAAPPAGMHPLRLLAVRSEAYRRASDRRETLGDAAQLARPLADSPEWAVRWAAALVEAGDGADRAQFEPCLQALAPVIAGKGAQAVAAAKAAADLHLRLGRPAEALAAVAQMPGEPAAWERWARHTAAAAAAAAGDRPMYERVLDAALQHDPDLAWNMTADNRWRAPEEWRQALAERAVAGLRDARRRLELQLWLARLRRDAGDAAGATAVLAQARVTAGDSPRLREPLLLLELDLAQRRRDAAAEDAVAAALLANTEKGIEAWREVGDGLKRWLEPRLAALPATTADTALRTVMRCGNQAGLWAAGQLITRTRASDPIAAALLVQRSVRTIWRDDRDNCERVQALVQAEADAGRAGIAAGAFANMAAWFNPDRVGQERIDQIRRLAAVQLAKAGGVGAALDDADPRAPLLRAAALLGSGDEDEAWRIIKERQQLLRDNLSRLPADLVLLAARRLAGDGDLAAGRALAEGLLRAQGDDGEGPARARLLLGDFAMREDDLPSATLEFQQVIAAWPKSRAALEANLRLGDCLLAARQADQARKIYEQFTASEDDETRIRAHARIAMLELQAGNKPRALELFREIAAMNPPRNLADQLYLDWGRALIGANRLQEAEEVLTLVGLAHGEDPIAPGEPLRITLRDPYLQTSQARSAVPVVVRSASGDEEVVEMTLSAEAKGVFAARIATALGEPVKGDRVLQVRGGDAITYDYTEDFKKGRRVVALGSGAIPIASDAALKAAATQEGVRFAGEGEAKDQGLANLGLGAVDEEDAALARSQSRTYRGGDQLKPGNPLYLAVLDADRDVSEKADRVAVILQSAAGDRVQAELVETGPHTGLFQAEVATGLRPADIRVSDSAPGVDPAVMLTQPDAPGFDRAETAWIAAGDRKAGKTITLDLKQRETIDQLMWSRGRATAKPDRRITAYRVEVSPDGEEWSTLYDTREKVALTGVLRWIGRRAAKGGTVRTSRAAEQALARLDLSPPRGERERKEVQRSTSAAWDRETTGEGGPVEHLAQGVIVIPESGRYEFAVRGAGRCWVMVGDRLVVEKERDEADQAEAEPRWRGGLDLDYGQARVRILSNSDRGLKGGTLLWRRPGQKVFEVIPSTALDSEVSPKDLAAFVGGAPATATALTASHGASLAFKPFQARFVRLVIDAWDDGDAPAIAALTLGGGGKRLLPAPGVDYAALARNEVLELSAGDEVTASYRDEKTKRKVAEVLRSRLTATYFDGRIEPLEVRTVMEAGRMREELYPRYRFRAGETIALRVSEFDADTTNKPDTVKVRVTSSAGSIELTATETGKATGVFQAEVKTVAAGGATAPGPGVLPVKPGEQVQLSYRDQSNVRPGGPVERTALLREVVASDGTLAILPTTSTTDPATGKSAWTTGAPVAKAEVVLAPLHIEVNDPDAMVSAGSRVRVRVATERGAVQDLLLAPSGDPAGGLFAGSVALVLGTPADGTMPVLPVGVPRGSAAPAQPGPLGAVPAMPVVGGERITVTYLEGVARNAADAAVAEVAAKPSLPSGEARLVTAGALRLTEDDFATPVAGLHVAGKLCFLVVDPDADTSDARDAAVVEISAASGDRLTIQAGETELHSGVFTGSIPLSQGAAVADDLLQVALGDTLTVTYREAGRATAPSATLPVAKGHDAALSVFAKRFADDQLAARTQLRLAESWFEIYKRQRQDLKAMEKAKGRPQDIAALKAAIAESLSEGTSLLQRTVSDDPDGAQADQVLFLLGNFEQESGTYLSAIDRYRSLLGQFPDSQRAADAQFKIAQCFEEQKRFDDAWEAYVRLAYRWPDHELVADAMARIGLYYDDRGKGLAKAAREAWLQANPGAEASAAPMPKEAVVEFTQAAAVYAKLVDRFPDHRIADQIMLAHGNSLYQCARWLEAQRVFDAFLLKYPGSPALPKGLYWAASAALEAGDARGAYLRFGRLTQDFPDSNEAKFARGRLMTDKRLKGVTMVDEK